jgi:hypothetical protein
LHTTSEAENQVERGLLLDIWSEIEKRERTRSENARFE